MCAQKHAAFCWLVWKGISLGLSCCLAQEAEPMSMTSGGGTSVSHLHPRSARRSRLPCTSLARVPCFPGLTFCWIHLLSSRQVCLLQLKRGGRSTWTPPCPAVPARREWLWGQSSLEEGKDPCQQLLPMCHRLCLISHFRTLTSASRDTGLTSFSRRLAPDLTCFLTGH